MTSCEGPDRQSGFVISIEFILTVTILVLGSLVGLIAIRNALFELRENKLAHTVIVKDSTPAPIGPIRFKPASYDLCEAPQILCRDPGLTPADLTTPGDTEGLFALVGIRPDRFVSRNRIYFDSAGCTGTAFIARPGDPSLPIGYLNCGLQVDAAGDPVCYGVGPPSNYPCTLGVDCADPGLLHRSVGTTPSTVAVASRWISLNPDCTTTQGTGGGGSTGELVANASFESPALVDGAALFFVVGAPWTLVGTGGTFDPLDFGPGLPDPPFDGPHFSPGAPPTLSPTQNVPEGDNTFFANAASISQAIAGVPVGGTCTLSVWIGRRTDYGPPTPPFVSPQSFSVTLSNAAPAVVGSIPGSITTVSPEWQQFTTTFSATGPGPFTLALSSGGVQVNFDLVSLTCTSPGAAASTAICEDVALSLDLLPTTEVVLPDTTPATGTPHNILTGILLADPTLMTTSFLPYTLPFNVMPWVPSVTFPAGGPESAPVLPLGAPGPTGPGTPISNPPGAAPGAFPDGEPESAPPPPWRGAESRPGCSRPDPRGLARPGTIRNSGYVLSLALILIFTVVVIGSLVGLAAVRNGLFQRAGTLLIRDSTAPIELIVGRPLDYDLCEAPQVLCRDTGLTPANTTTPGPTQGLFALVAVRPDRFVSRDRIYYTGPGCTIPAGDTAYIAPPAVTTTTPVLPVGHLNALETVSYGVGAPANWPGDMTTFGPGLLYRSDGTTVVTPEIRSIWTSLAPDCTLEGSGGGASGCLAAPPDMVAWWPLDGDGTDIVGTNNGTTTGSASFVPGLVDQALMVLGNSGFVVPDDPNLDFGTGDLSIDAWIRTSAGGVRPIVDKRLVAALRGYFLFLDGGLLGFQLGDGAALTDYLSPAPEIADDSWHHVAVTLDRDDSLGLDLYVDGTLIATFDPTGSAGSLDNTSDLLVADRVDMGSSLNGLIDEVELFNRVLTAAEIGAIFGAGANGKCKTVNSGSTTTAICENFTSPLMPSLLPAVEVVDSTGGNLLEGYTPPFKIEPPWLTFTPAMPEGASVQIGPGLITGPGLPPTFPDPGIESDPPLDPEVPGAPGPGDPITTPPAEPEGG